MNFNEWLSQQRQQPPKEPPIDLDEFTRALTSAQIQQFHEHLAILQKNGIASFYSLALMFSLALDDKRRVIQTLRNNLSELNEAFTLISDERVSRE